MQFTRRWGRIVRWVALLLWPALLPHPANAVAGCIWYSIVGLSGMVYFLSRIQDDTTERQGLAPPVTPTPPPAQSAAPGS